MLGCKDCRIMPESGPMRWLLRQWAIGTSLALPTQIPLTQNKREPNIVRCAEEVAIYCHRVRNGSCARRSTCRANLTGERATAGTAFEDARRSKTDRSAVLLNGSEVVASGDLVQNIYDEPQRQLPSP